MRWFAVDSPGVALVRRGIVTALLVLSLAVPGALSLVVGRHGPVRWVYAGAAGGCFLAAVTLLAATMVRVRRRDRYEPPVLTGFAVFLSGLVAVGLVDMAGRFPPAVAVPALMAVMAFVAIVGDRPMRVLGLAAAVGVLVAMVVVSGMTGSDRTVLLVVGIWSLVVLVAMIDRFQQHIKEENEARLGLRAVADAMAGETGLAAALARGLPLVHRVLPGQAALILRGRPPAVEEVASWSAQGIPPDAAKVATLPQYARALSTVDVEISRDWCMMPIGLDGDRPLILVVRHRAGRGDTDLVLREQSRSVAGVFLGAVNRTSLVTRLRHESRTDPLTGLANRRALLERLADELEVAGPRGAALTVAMIDVDHFKQFNDTHGHVAGDAALRGLAATFASEIRAGDLLARYGGEEFCLVLPATELQGALVLLEKLRRARPIPGLTVSAGLAAWDGREPAEDMIRRADRALYRAKAAGRDRVMLAPT